eukprot:2557611-Alexandrium_andersonii.AAC.2
MYSDNAPEIIAAMKEFRIPGQHSQPGTSKENAVAERANRDILEMTRAALVQGGLPACFWTEAAPCVSFLSNVSSRGTHGGARGAKSDKTFMNWSPGALSTACRCLSEE